jgi:hypothetical protein
MKEASIILYNSEQKYAGMYMHKAKAELLE